MSATIIFDPYDDSLASVLMANTQGELLELLSGYLGFVEDAAEELYDIPEGSLRSVPYCDDPGYEFMLGRRELYAEVADGNFGPEGLTPTYAATQVALYDELLAGLVS